MIRWGTPHKGPPDIPVTSLTKRATFLRGKMVKVAFQTRPAMPNIELVSLSIYMYVYRLGGSVGGRQRLVGGSLFLRLSNRYNLNIPSRCHIYSCSMPRVALSRHIYTCMFAYICGQHRVAHEHNIYWTYRHACLHPDRSTTSWTSWTWLAWTGRSSRHVFAFCGQSEWTCFVY